MTYKRFLKSVFIFICTIIIAQARVFADQADVCGKQLSVDQLTEIDEKNVKLVTFGSAQIIARASVAEAVMAAYAGNQTAAKAQGAEKWKDILESCNKQNNPKLAAKAFTLYVANLDSDKLNYDYLDAVILNDAQRSQLAAEIASNKGFEHLPVKVKNLIFLSIGIGDVHLLRVDYLGKSFFANDDFRNYAELKLTEALKVKNIKSAKSIAAMLEMLYISNAEKYKKYGLACNLIEDLLSNGSELTGAQLLTLVSIRNTDMALRAVLDPFLIEGFNTLANATYEKGKYEEALNQISSINTDQATPTTYLVIEKIISHIDPASKVLQNETVNNLLRSAANSSPEVRKKLQAYYISRTKVLLEDGEFSDAVKTQENLKALPESAEIAQSLKINFALKYLQNGNKRLAAEALQGMKLSFGDRVKLFIDGYYGNPLLYILIILVPLVIKISYELFTKVKVTPVKIEAEETEVKNEIPENTGYESDVSQFVSSSRTSKQKNVLYEEYKDCLSIFSLEKGSDLKTIKTAYRNAVRKIHPDLKTDNQSPNDASRFVELTKTYDRLRELHRLLGFETK